MKMLISKEWMRRKILEDGDGDVEAGMPLDLGTAMAKRLSDNEPFTTLMLREQEKLARIGGKPCEWSPEQWADWNEGKG